MTHENSLKQVPKILDNKACLFLRRARHDFLASMRRSRLKARPCWFYRDLTTRAETGSDLRAKPDAMTTFRTTRLATRIETIPGNALILGLLLLRRP